MATILIVDDSASERRIIRSIVHSLGHEVVEMVNGQDVLAYLLTSSVDMILVDYHMPLMNGIEMVRQVRLSPDCQKIPIIMITLESKPEVKEASKAAGVNGWLVKPFKEEKLLDVVTKYFPYNI